MKMAQTAFKPVKSRQTVQDQVYEQMRQALVGGAFEAGEAFTISSLADKFGTSHMPVREALRRLAAENALRISATGTAMVPPLEPDELTKIFEARMIIEPATAGLAFDTLKQPSYVMRLKENLAQHKATGQSGQIVEMLAANRAFHFEIYGAAQNEVLLSQIENLWLRSGPYTRFLSDRIGELLRTDYKSGYTIHHEAMLEALTADDRAAFVAAMEADLRATRDLLLDSIVQAKAV